MHNILSLVKMSGIVAADVPLTSLLDEQNYNAKMIVCSLCSSKILLAGKGSYVELSTGLPEMHKKTEDADFKLESIKQYYCVQDMYEFENIGFSKTVESIKYLTCADCEIGPIGYHDIDTKKNYIALVRVKHI